MANAIANGTAQGVLEYLDSLVAKGRSRIGVVSPLKTALTKVLQKTEGADWIQTDVTAINIHDVMSRFKNLTLGEYTEGSYHAYELRVAKAIKWYSTFLKNPGWAPVESARSNTLATNRKGQNILPAEGGKDTEYIPHKQHTINLKDEVRAGVAPVIETVNKVDMAYPFPLSTGETAVLHLPRTISRVDVKRISAFIDALVIEEDAHG